MDDISEMHVLIIPSWYPASSMDLYGAFFREQAIALAKRNVLTSVFAPRSFPRNPCKWKNFLQVPYFLEDNGVATYRPWFMNWSLLVNGQRTSIINKASKWFQGYCMTHGKPDIIHAHCAFPGGEIAMAISQKHDIPFVITEHSSLFGRELISPCDLLKAQKLFSSADALVTVSADLLHTIESSCSTLFSRKKVIPNILSDVFLAAPPPGPVKNVYTFLSVAVLTSNKRHDLLLKAFARSFVSDESVELRIGGNGVEMKRLQKLAFDLGVANRVKFLGMLDRDQVLCEMQQCNALVVSSEVETFGLVIIEALAQGKPVISTRCGGPEEILHDNNGILIQNNDVEALSRAMTCMRKQSSEYDSDFIRKDCLSRFSKQVVIAQIILLYEDLLRKRCSTLKQHKISGSITRRIVT